MKNNDLTGRLNDMTTPEINLAGHKIELKKVLMERHSIPPKPAFSVLLSRIINNILSGLFSRQPVWKTTVLGAVVMGLVLSGVLIPAMTSNSVYAKAMDLIEYGQEIRNELGTGDNQSSKIFTVTLDGNEGTASLDDEGRMIITFPSGLESMDNPTIVIGKHNKDGELLKMSPGDIETIRLSVGKDEGFNYIIVILDE